MKIFSVKKILLGLVAFCFAASPALPVFATDGAPAGGTDIMGVLGSMWPILIIIVLFYFMLFRPQQKKEKAQRLMLSELKVGDNVVTIGGVCGKITSIKDDMITVETGADKVKIKFKRFAVKDVDKLENAE